MTEPRKPVKKSTAKKPAKTRQRGHRRVSRDNFTDAYLDELDQVAIAVATQLPTQAALPAVGETANNVARTNISTPDLSGLNLSLPECAARMGWSLKTAYRKVRAGQLAGAHKVVGASGETWQIPVATIDRLANAQANKQNLANPDAAHAKALEQQVFELQLELATVRAQAHERGLVVEQLQNTMRALTVATEQLSLVNDEKTKTIELTQAALQVALNRKWWQRSGARRAVVEPDPNL